MPILALDGVPDVSLPMTLDEIKTFTRQCYDEKEANRDEKWVEESMTTILKVILSPRKEFGATHVVYLNYRDSEKANEMLKTEILDVFPDVKKVDVVMTKTEQSVRIHWE